MRDLEDSIRRHRAAFDTVEEPRADLIWERIRSPQPPAIPAGERPSGWKIHIGRNWRWTIAAAVALITGILLAWPVPAPENGSAYQLADFYPELAEQEQQYLRLVADKEKAIDLPNINRNDHREIFAELALLDELQAQTLRDLPRYFDNEQLVRTLIKNYEQRIRILERLSLEIEKNKRHEARKQQSERRI